MRQTCREKRGGGIATRMNIWVNRPRIMKVQVANKRQTENYFPVWFAVSFVIASGQQSFLWRPSFETSWFEKQRSTLSNLHFRNESNANPGKRRLRCLRGKYQGNAVSKPWAHQQSKFLILGVVQKHAGSKWFAT